MEYSSLATLKLLMSTASIKPASKYFGTQSASPDTTSSWPCTWFSLLKPSMLSASSVTLTAIPVELLTALISSLPQWSLHVRKLSGPGLALGTGLMDGAALAALLAAGLAAPPVDGAGDAAPVHAARNAANEVPALTFRNCRRVY